MSTYNLVKQCSVCGNRYDQREIDEQEASDRKYTALMVNYDQYDDTEEIVVTGYCDGCQEEA